MRRRFPHIPVIAIGGEFNSIAPTRLIADAFFRKGDYTQEELFHKIAALLETSPRPHIARADKSPVWTSRNEAGYFVVTCTDCLRSFSIPDEHSGSELRETKCVFCDTTVCYLANLKLPKKPSRQAG